MGPVYGLCMTVICMYGVSPVCISVPVDSSVSRFSVTTETINKTFLYCLFMAQHKALGPNSVMWVGINGDGFVCSALPSELRQLLRGLLLGRKSVND